MEFPVQKKYVLSGIALSASITNGGSGQQTGVPVFAVYKKSLSTLNAIATQCSRIAYPQPAIAKKQNQRPQEAIPQKTYRGIDARGRQELRLR